MKKTAILFFIILFAVSTFNLSAQGKESSIELRFLFIKESTSNVITNFNFGPNVSLKNNLYGGSLTYNYHYSDDWTFYFEAGAIAANINISNSLFSSSTETSTLIPIHIGGKYYITGFYSDVPFKPYLKGGIGLVTGVESNISTLQIEEHSETVPMLNVAGGVDLRLASWIKAGFEIGYLSMSDFDSPISQRTNYSDFEYSFGFAFIF